MVRISSVLFEYQTNRTISRTKSEMEKLWMELPLFFFFDFHFVYTLRATKTCSAAIASHIPVIVGLRSQFKYSTWDFTGITNPSCIKKTRLFKNHSDLKSL